MTKEEIGQYYAALPFGERTHFLVVVECFGGGYKVDRWRRVILRWSKKKTRGKSLTKMEEDVFLFLIRNHHWRIEYSKIMESIKTTRRTPRYYEQRLINNYKTSKLK